MFGRQVTLKLKANSAKELIRLNDNEILKQLALLCAAGLFVSLLMLTYGIDLSPGFF